MKEKTGDWTPFPVTALCILEESHNSCEEKGSRTCSAVFSTPPGPFPDRGP